ncbi:MAG: hypothetical protein HOL37_03525 [Rhodospirillaceae bacterium]|jgi:hypothetical protein|nr:hypothetical protein [Rhodospirillaceae bacterium]MBT4218496.1 hypothetical protein [Rhodospirillaceae bacterium]MBT5014627.1 hypothetical protein [Rhodospirillaceae bacterium]MBT5308384.1 hypothetical protein [Rhodospirillaceae bacterium]MBT7355914.1 hypothetical protein [Rhodospirillaceae bacterium]
MKTGYPRQVATPHRKIPLTVPDGMTPVEFFNSAANLRNLADDNGLLRTPEDFLLYRKAIGHSVEFDTSVILDTSQRILDPLGRPVRRDQLSDRESKVFSRMSHTIIEYMAEQYPDPGETLIMCGEASLDATWPLCKPGVPTIRMIHNHFIAFSQADLKGAPAADPDNPNLTDGGHHSLFLYHLSDVYHEFLEVLDLQVMSPMASKTGTLGATGYPQGLPSWVVRGGMDGLAEARFWREYDDVLKGFLDFYRAFFTLVASPGGGMPANLYYPNQVENVLLFNNHFHRVAKEIRDRIKGDPQFANEIRWRPAYKQIIYRDDEGRLIVTISQNSIGNAITEMLGIVVERTEDEEAYARAEPALMSRLHEVRDRLVTAGIGEAINDAP